MRNEAEVVKEVMYEKKRLKELEAEYLAGELDFEAYQAIRTYHEGMLNAFRFVLGGDVWESQ